MGEWFGSKPATLEPSLRCSEYRRLLLWSLVLQVRMQLLSALLTLSSPFATYGWLLLLRRWFDALKRDAAEFGKAARAWRSQQMAFRQAAVTFQEFHNPWV